ncbi:unnamed protein product [Caenorhabditis angaria]|uniref:Uncharacterized protein n=1 Tax=Caenorhabditis angaria TaxID=860376 RepID=A0A9P1INM0_9PELO|nr:unnamed protein product [Caenorhabditis angaria]
MNSTIYRIRATVIYTDDTESEPSESTTISIQDLKSTSPLILDTKILSNSTVLITFLPGQSMKNVENYTVSYRIMPLGIWETFDFLSDETGTFMLEDLEPNMQYKVKMRLMSGIGTESNSVLFITSTAALATIKMEPSQEISLDPNDKEKLIIKCTVTSTQPCTVFWKVNSEPVPKDTSVYNIKTQEEDKGKYFSTIETKTRSRSALYTCVAKNDAGETSQNVTVTITGPGSPPTEIGLKAENDGYTVTWKPPSVKNGKIVRYIVYFTTQSFLPVQFWEKRDLDGEQFSTHIPFVTTEGFFVRIQSAIRSGPGIISDIVGLAPNASPIKITMTIDGKSVESAIVEPRTDVEIFCDGTGFPKPSLSMAKSQQPNPKNVEPDAWIPLKENEGIVAKSSKLLVYTSKFVHCRGKNNFGSNFSTIELVVEKPGDAPSEIQVLNINPLDATVVWKNPQFPNLPITRFTILISKETTDDLNTWQPITHEVQNETFAQDQKHIYQQTINIQNLDKSSTYFVRVQAENRAGAGPASKAIQFNTTDGGPNVPPENVRVMANEANLVHILWDAPKTPIKITDYAIHYTRDTAEDDYIKWQIVYVPSIEGETSYRKKLDFSILAPKTFYRFRVIPRNLFANGTPSPQVQFETSKQIPIPTDLQIEVNKDNSVDIHFEAAKQQNERFEKYVVSLSTSPVGAELLDETKWTNIRANVDFDEINSMVHIKIHGDDLLKNQSYNVRICPTKNDVDCVLKMTWSPIAQFKTSHGKIETLAYWEALENEGVLKFDPDLNEKIEVSCVARGNPIPKITWSWNNSSLGDDWEIKEENINANHQRATAIRSHRTESGQLTCRAENEEGNAETSLDIIISGPGSPPTFVNITSYQNEIRLSWREPEISNGEIVRYAIYVTKDKDEEDLSDWHKFETSETQWDFPNFGAETEHFIRFQAFSTNGVGIISEIYNVTSDEYYESITLEIFDSNESANFEADPNETKDLICRGSGKPIPQIFYKFEDEEDEQKIDDSELIIRRGGDEFEAKLPAKSSKKNLTVECWAKNKYEIVKDEKTIFVKLPGDAPKNLKWWFEENNDTHIFFSWDPPKYPNGFIENYSIYIGPFEMRVSGPPARYGEVLPNINFTVRIAAINEYGMGEKSMPVFVTTPNRGPKTPPVVIKIAQENEETSRVYVEWIGPTKPNGIIQYFTIYTKRKGDEFIEWQKTTHQFNATSTIFDSSAGFDENVDYELKMTATNERFESPFSGIHVFRIGNSSDQEEIQNSNEILEFSASFRDDKIDVEIFGNSSNFDEFLVKIWRNQTNLLERKMNGDRKFEVKLEENDKDLEISITGIRNNLEIITSDKIIISSQKSLSENSDLSENSPSNNTNVKDKRYQIKEPPL